MNYNLKKIIRRPFAKGMLVGATISAGVMTPVLCNYALNDQIRYEEGFIEGARTMENIYRLNDELELKEEQLRELERQILESEKNEFII
jgi:hypothetical protein